MKLSDLKKEPQLIKMILMGYSGLGKSSSIVPLSIPGFLDSPGYELRVLDADGKFSEVAFEQLKWRLDEKQITSAQYDAALEKIDVAVIRENTKVVTVGQDKKIGVVGQPTAWKALIRQLEKWSTDFNHSTILVVDSFTHLATSVIPNYTQALNNKTNQPLSWQDFHAAQQLVQQFLTLIADLPTHSILCAHQEPLEIYKKTGEEITKPNGTVEQAEELVESMMAPISVGNKGRTKIPAQLNHMLVCAQSPSGERRIYTQTEDGVVCKTPFFGRTERFYSISDGLVKYFKLAGE